MLTLKASIFFPLFYIRASREVVKILSFLCFLILTSYFIKTTLKIWNSKNTARFAI